MSHQKDKKLFDIIVALHQRISKLHSNCKLITLSIYDCMLSNAMLVQIAEQQVGNRL